MDSRLIGRLERANWELQNDVFSSGVEKIFLNCLEKLYVEICRNVQSYMVIMPRIKYNDFAYCCIKAVILTVCTVSLLPVKLPVKQATQILEPPKIFLDKYNNLLNFCIATVKSHKITKSSNFYLFSLKYHLFHAEILFFLLILLIYCWIYFLMINLMILFLKLMNFSKLTDFLWFFQWSLNQCVFW